MRDFILHLLSYHRRKSRTDVVFREVDALDVSDREYVKHLCFAFFVNAVVSKDNGS